MDVKQYIWNYFLNKGFTPYGIAGMMGNMQKESRFLTNNVEDTAPYTDVEYTNMVDNNTYDNFANDNYGYGLVQWTFHTLKQDLLNLCKSRNKSISDIDCQLDQLYEHLKSEGVYNRIKNSTSLEDATIYFLLKFEKPTDKGSKEQQERIKYAKEIYDLYNNGKGESEDMNDKIVNNQVYFRGYYQLNDEGSEVKAFQEKLIKLGYSCGVDGADGDFGPNTLLAVQQFQQEYGLEVDGRVGEETLKALEIALNKKETPSIKIYRIRKSWTEPRTQVGAYSNLDVAIAAFNKLPSGYYIFDNNGNCVYPKDAIIDKKSDKFKPIILPARQYVDVALGSASKDENGRYIGGQAGDQTSKEVYILNAWYDQNWTSVLRPTDDQLAEKIAQACEAACDNPNIGYDQNQRNSLYTEAKKVNMNLSLIETPCECDCSSLVSICCICAGLPANIFYAGGNMRTTFNMEDACLKTGKFINLTDTKYIKQKDYLKRGDILLNRNQHVVIVLGNGKYSEAVTNPNAGIYRVKVMVDALNVRSAPSGNSLVVGRIHKDGVYTIVAVEGGWGKLKTGKGWINLEFVTQVE